MSVVTGSNKRKFQRMDTDFPISVDSSGKRFEARVQNLSQDGLQIEGPVAARVGEQFALTFGKGTGETFRARITWARPAGGGATQGGAFQFGCLFWAIDEEAKRQLLVRLIQFSSLHRPKPKPADASDPATPEPMSPEEAAAAATAPAAVPQSKTAPGGTQGGENGNPAGQTAA